MVKEALQAVLFNKKDWNAELAKIWLNKHHYVPIKMPHFTKHLIRFRLKDPKIFKRFITRKLGYGIELVIGYF